ncbi:MAG: hypothetical protein ACRC2S_18830 [Waterburya sp.]
MMHCVGGTWTQETLKDLLFTMPYVLYKFIPPFHVLKDLLQRGVPNDFFPDGLLPDGKVQYDAGMSGGCSWKPFEITQEEYDELVLDLLTDPQLQLEVLDIPSEIQTYKQWVYWKLKHLK